MGKKLGKSAATAAQELLRRAKHQLIVEREESIATSTAAWAKSNTCKEALHKWTVAERAREKICPDGTKMTLQKEIAYRERTGYGTEKYLKDLRNKLAGIDEKMAQASDDDLLAALDASDDEAEAA